MVAQDRVELLRREMHAERQAAVEAELAAQLMQRDPWGLGGLLGDDGQRFVAIRRSRLLLDGFERLNKLSAQQFKGRVRIQYIDEHGEHQPGGTHCVGCRQR